MGQVNFSGGTPSKFFYNQDHLDSARELTDSTGAIKTIYGYDPYGVSTETFVSGTTSADMQYAGYYAHARSGLYMPVYRAYNTGLGRFINRDPIEEKGGLNLYTYVKDNPVGFIDPQGLTNPAATLTRPLAIPGPLGEAFVVAMATYWAYVESVLLYTTVKKGWNLNRCLDKFAKKLLECKTKCCQDEAEGKFLKCLSNAGFDVSEIKRSAELMDAQVERELQELKAAKAAADAAKAAEPPQTDWEPFGLP
ncbi:MAG TPA: RHS repeat-associated core domain-containing protein [Candidatus Melainabacteria bacterium]|nr:RHS repeat-associated core domain-containing protein [Candidatus Melainabacteria bacterium]